ncbi:peptide deformylase [Arthrobacter pityocampae]|uniref:Peptide deformylase n=1 Tax=Arthrobacter pityocampae TaxID=547334 RepID=A0A2S5IZE5_9MICC|nr:peptide deformylase [Arthrobacter pityocampae]PPB49962.1 peptide deformylase [Arthrobacter pityocampae]
MTADAPRPTAAAPLSREAIAAHVESVLAADLPRIVAAGHPVLRRPAQDYDGQLDDDTLARLLDTMRRVMHAAPGVGLAAPQIGIPLRIAVLEDAGTVDPAVAAARSRPALPFTVLLNPRYAAAGGSVAAFYEGCLSVPGYQAVVERPHRIEATYTQPDGRTVTAGFEGWPARIVQHETDHLDGTLYLDRAILRSLSADAEHHRWAQPTIDEARRGLGF